MTLKKAAFPSSIRAGKARAREALAERDRANSRRSRALRGLAAAGVGSRGVLIAEGDSWFDYPFDDVLAELEDGFGFDVESVAHRGDTIEDMAYGRGQFAAFTRCLDRTLRRGTPPAAVLLSGGGNDIAGDHFSMLLDNASAAVAALCANVSETTVRFLFSVEGEGTIEHDEVSEARTQGTPGVGGHGAERG